MKEKEESIKDLKVKIMQLIYIILIVAIFYLALNVAAKISLFAIIGKFFKILTPFFIGLFIAWLFSPVVDKLEQKGVKRIFGTIFVYIVFLAIIVIFSSLIFPVFYDQVTELTKAIPGFLKDFSSKIDNFTYILSDRFNIDYKTLSSSTTNLISEKLTDFAKVGPSKLVSLIISALKGGAKFGIGLVLGFYLLSDFKNVKNFFKKIIPIKTKKDTLILISRLELTLRQYVKSALIVVLILFIFQTTTFIAVGLKAPMAFGLFCALTNMIPYIGPYIGGIPAIMFGFNQGYKVGVLTFLVVVTCQLIESNLVTPNIMTKTMKIHPVVTIVGLTIFGSLFGIVGMLFSTPTIACFKVIIDFFNEKYHLFEVKK